LKHDASRSNKKGADGPHLVIAMHGRADL
jgi:hypothetical protein